MSYRKKLIEVALPLEAINEGQRPLPPRYVIQPFSQEPDFGITSVNYNLNDLLAISEEPQ